MLKVLQFLQESQTFFLATIEDGQPRVRPFGLAFEFEGRLCFGTSSDKPVYAQIKANPNIEICACSQDGKWLRLRGLAVFEQSIDAQKKAIELMPQLSRMYTPGDGKFTIFSINDAAATFSGFDMKPETVRF